jgi:hypothetical protein
VKLARITATRNPHLLLPGIVTGCPPRDLLDHLIGNGSKTTGKVGPRYAAQRRSVHSLLVVGLLRRPNPLRDRRIGNPTAYVGISTVLSRRSRPGGAPLGSRTGALGRQVGHRKALGSGFSSQEQGELPEQAAGCRAAAGTLLTKSGADRMRSAFPLGEGIPMNHTGILHRPAHEFGIKDPGGRRPLLRRDPAGCASGSPGSGAPDSIPIPAWRRRRA